MSLNATQAFIFHGENDWKLSVPDDWDLDVVELDGTEKVVGHLKIDGSICKIVKLANGQLIALSK